MRQFVRTCALRFAGSRDNVLHLITDGDTEDIREAKALLNSYTGSKNLFFLMYGVAEECKMLMSKLGQSIYKYLLAHLFVMVPRPGDHEMTFSVFKSSCYYYSCYYQF